MDWLQVSEIPPFLLENPHSGITVQELTVPPRRLRNDSYLGAIHKDNILVRAGLQVHLLGVTCFCRILSNLNLSQEHVF